MADKLKPLDDRLKQLIRELSPIAGDPLAIGSVKPPLEKFVADLFDEIEKVILAERNKPGSKTAIQFWGTVKEAIDQIKRRAIEP